MSEPAGRRPRFVVGPGLVTAILVSALVWMVLGPPGGDHSREMTAPGSPSPETVAPAPEPPAEGITPAPTWLLRHAVDLKLTPQQTEGVERVVFAWEEDTAAARAALDAETRRLSGALDAEPRRSGADAAALGREAGEYSALSAQLADARQTAWREALALLTDAQREQVAALRRQAPLEME